MSIGSSCAAPDSFLCADDEQCVDHGAPGTCEASGFCSFPDPTCASGRRFGHLADAEHRNTCAPDPPGDAGTGVAEINSTGDAQGSSGSESESSSGSSSESSSGSSAESSSDSSSGSESESRTESSSGSGGSSGSGWGSSSGDESASTGTFPESACQSCVELDCAIELDDCADVFACSCWASCYPVPDICSEACGADPPAWDALAECMSERCDAACL